MTFKQWLVIRALNFVKFLYNDDSTLGVENLGYNSTYIAPKDL